MKWLVLVAAACGSSSPPRDEVGERVATMQAVKTPFTLEVMTLDSTSADRAKQFETELRAAAREYVGVTVRVSGKHLSHTRPDLPSGPGAYGHYSRSSLEILAIL